MTPVSPGWHGAIIKDRRPRLCRDVNWVGSKCIASNFLNSRRIFKAVFIHQLRLEALKMNRLLLVHALFAAKRKRVAGIMRKKFVEIAPHIGTQFVVNGDRALDACRCFLRRRVPPVRVIPGEDIAGCRSSNSAHIAYSPSIC